MKHETHSTDLVGFTFRATIKISLVMAMILATHFILTQ